MPFLWPMCDDCLFNLAFILEFGNSDLEFSAICYTLRCFWPRLDDCLFGIYVSFEIWDFLILDDPVFYGITD